MKLTKAEQVILVGILGELNNIRNDAKRTIQRAGELDRLLSRMFRECEDA